MDKLQKAISDSPLVRAAIIEAVHRFYYDRALSDKQRDQEDLEETRAAEILDKLWNLHPEWRHTLLTLPQRYKCYPTNCVSIFGKPKCQDAFIVGEIVFS